jgi:hypothetical protein
VKTAALGFVIAGTLVAAFVLVILALLPAPRPRPMADSMADITRQLELQTIVIDREVQASTERLMRLDLGDATVDLTIRCTNDPPKQPTNQRRCQQAAAKIDRWRANRAEQAKEEAAW